MRAWIISSTVLVLAVLLLRALFKKRISPGLRYGLWLVVLIRLLLPVSIGGSVVSVMNYVPPVDAVQEVTAPLITGQETEFKPYTSESPENEELLAPIESSRGENLEFSFHELWLSLYYIGAVLVLAATVFSNLRFVTRLKANRSEKGSFMGLTVYESAAIETPCLFGLFKPCIYLSVDVAEENCKHVLMHEHAHYCQRDHIWSWLRGLCLALHWYNPFVWLAALLSKRDGELSCDARVVASLTAEERIRYGQTLINLSVAGNSALLCAVTPLSAKGKALKERIEYVAKKPVLFMGNMALALAALLIVTGCTFTGEKEAAAPNSESDNIPVEMLSSTVYEPVGMLLDRDGRELNKENFAYYQDTVEVFSDYLENSSVMLTIDLELQQEAKRIIEETVFAPSSSSGCAVVLDVKTGAPLAIVGLGEAIDPLTVSFKPYSLFYPCTAATALSVGIIRPEETIKCEGVFDRYAEDGISEACWIHEHGLTHPALDMKDALQNSCGYYFCCLGNDNGIDDTERTAHAMGLGVMSGIELPSGSGLMPGRETAKAYGMVWNIGHTLETVMGEGLCSFTPLQLAQYCGTIANNGTRYSASILQSISNENGERLYTRQPSVLSMVNGLADEDWQAIQNGLQLVCYDPKLPQNKDIAASLYESFGDWTLAGKTAYSNDDSLFSESLFMGYAPFDDPQIAVVSVVISKYGNAAATEIGLELIAAYKNMM